MAYYRATLHSNTALSGDWQDGVYFVDLPEVLQGEHMLAVESFVIAPSLTAPILVTCPTLPQGNAYSTVARGLGFNLLTVPSTGTYIERVHRGTLGCKLQDPAFLRGKQVRVQLTDIRGIPLNIANPAGVVWVMTLVVWKPEEEAPGK